jgi:hypothetical protein
MIAHKKEFTGGVVMMIGFWIVFAILLSPVFGGKNLLDFMDGMYNSISKSSSNFFPATRKKVESLKGKTIDLKIKVPEGSAAERRVIMLKGVGLTVENEEKALRVSGDLGMMMDSVLADAEAMYANDGEKLKARYGYEGREVLYGWWNILSDMEKSLNKQERFKESKILYQVKTKTVEPAYNYYGIQAQNIKEKAFLVILSLGGYVIYTLWFGFAILFMFEGWGLKLEH